MSLTRLTAVMAIAIALSISSVTWAKDDPDLYRPERTTGGQIGFGVGLAAGAWYGGPQGAGEGAVVGALIGHGTDRVITRISNDVTGPAWKKLEKKTKHWSFKQYRLLTVEGAITLPFVPYPGLYVTLSKPHWKSKKKEPVKLYLRIRTVDWQVTERYFECVADETFAREPGFEVEEVRGSPRIEKHFVELQKSFKYLGFDVSTETEAMLWGVHKAADGTELGSSEQYFDPR